MNNQYAERAKEVLESIKYATVATATRAGKPWNSPVYAMHDPDLNLYWFSDKESQHSRNIRENADVMIVIYDSTVPVGRGSGVYMEAKAVELNEAAEISVARGLRQSPDNDGPDAFMGEAVLRAYRAVPERMWTNVPEMKDGKFVRLYREEVPMDELKRLLAE